MKTSIIATFLFALFFLPAMAFCQPSIPSCLAKEKLPFSNCAAIFLNDKMLVDEYSPRGEIRISPDSDGKIYVSTVNFSLDLLTPYKSIGFKVAIRNKKTNTLWMYSDETYAQINLKSILSKCEVGDEIVLLTVDKEYSLSHNTIKIDWGC